MIIPDELSLGVGVVALSILGTRFMGADNFTVEHIIYDICAGLGASAFFAGLWFISKGRWIGLGDAKLALPLGIIVGVTGVFSMVILSFWVGAAISLTLLGLERILKRGKTNLHFLTIPLTIKSEVPFAPFLIVGFSLVYLFHANIFDFTYAFFFAW
jgi:prepilin signal peptidase PulO-like enzyme (type II secretory pathway)